MTPIIEALKRARGRLARPNGWTKGAYGRTATGKDSLARFEDNCVCWCVIGAVRAEVFSDAPTTDHSVREHDLTGALLLTLVQRGYLGRLSDFNDEQSTVEPVLALYDETIARLEAEASA